MSQQADQGRAEHGKLSYGFAALGVLTSLALGIATLSLGLSPIEPDQQQPSVSIEESNGGAGSDTPKSPNAPGFDPRQANLVETEDERLYAIVGQIQPGSTAHDVPVPGAAPTLVLPARTAPYDLGSLTSGGAVTKQPDGGLLLVHNVLVGPGAQLTVGAPNTTLRMSSGPGGITSIISFKGSINLGGADKAPLTLTSWDPTKNAPDTEHADGRAYLRAVGGRMDLHDLDTDDLGFWSGRTGGVAWTGSASEPSTGSARNVRFTGNHYGMFSSRTKGLLVNGAQVKGSTMDGIAVHRESDGTQLWRVSSDNNARNGIAVTQGAHNISLREATATGNARNGIYLDGTPLAFGPNAGGSTTVASSGFTVVASTSRANAEHGILVNTANNVELTGNTVGSNRDGIVVRGVTHGVQLRENHVSAPGGFAVAVRDGAKDAVVDKNVLSDALTAVQVDNAVAKVTGNEITGMGLHAVSIIGNGDGSSVVDNRMSGRGPSSVDLNRLNFANVVAVSGNDESNWVVDRNDVQYLANFIRKHPLILLWFLTLVFPLAARLYFKRRAKLRNLGGHPYGQGSIALTAPVAAVGPRTARTPRTNTGPTNTAAHTNTPVTARPARPSAARSPGPPARRGANPPVGAPAHQPRPPRPPRPGAPPGARPTPRTGQPTPPAVPGTSPPMNTPNGSPRNPAPHNGAPHNGQQRPPQPGGTRVTVVSEQ